MFRSLCLALPAIAGAAESDSLVSSRRRALSCGDYCHSHFGSQSSPHVEGTAPICNGDCYACSVRNEYCGPRASRFSDGGHHCTTGSKQCCCSDPQQVNNTKRQQLEKPELEEIEEVEKVQKTVTSSSRRRAPSCNDYCTGQYGASSIGYVMGTGPFCDTSCSDCRAGDACGPHGERFSDGGHHCSTGSKTCCCSVPYQVNNTKPQEAVKPPELEGVEEVEDVPELEEVDELEKPVTSSSRRRAPSCDEFCNSHGVRFGYVRGHGPFCVTSPNDCCDHDLPGIQASKFEDGGHHCSTGSKQCCCGTPNAGDEKSQCPRPRDLLHALARLSCNVIKGVCDIIGKGGGYATKSQCTSLSVEGAGLCVLVGLGPEDPFADTCAGVVGGVVKVACDRAVREFRHFAADECKRVAGCGTPADFSTNTTRTFVV